MAQQFPNRARKSICRNRYGKWTVYKVKMLILSESISKKFISSHLPRLKYFLMVTLKSDIWRKHSCISHTKLLVKRAGFTVYLLPLNLYRIATAHLHIMGTLHVQILASVPEQPGSVSAYPCYCICISQRRICIAHTTSPCSVHLVCKYWTVYLL